jgi:hypothetical protein
MTRYCATQRSGERGQILVFVAVTILGVIGIGALSIDAAYMYDKRNKLYAAADAAAKSAAFAYNKDPASDAHKWDFGRRELELLGLTPVTACGSTSGYALCVSRPPTVGVYASVSNSDQYVEAIVTAPNTATFFGRVLGWMSGNPGARAVAGAGTVNPAECIIIKQNLEMGNFSFNLSGCGVSVGGTLNCTNPTSEIIGTPTPPVDVTGASTGCNATRYMPGLNDNTGVAPIDPLKDDILAGTLSPPPTPNPADCRQGTTPTIGPGCYTNISAAVTTLLPGDYYITGTVNIDHLTGNDVFLYLTNTNCGAPCGHINGGGFNVVGQNKLLHLTPHTSGMYSGIPVWQVESDTRPFSCLGCGPAGSDESWPPNSFRLEWSGVLYMPGVDQAYKNHVEFVPLNGCGLYITRSLTVNNGNGTLQNSGCASTFGGAAFLSTAVVE